MDLVTPLFTLLCIVWIFGGVTALWWAIISSPSDAFYFLFLWLIPPFVVADFYTNSLRRTVVILVCLGILSSTDPQPTRLARDVLFSLLGLLLCLVALGAARILPWFVVEALPYLVIAALEWVVHRGSCRYFILCSPRFQNDDCFAGCPVCGLCQEVLGSSALLVGARFRLTRSVERHQVYRTIDEFRQSGENCVLCKGLSAGDALGDNHEDLPNYGTMPTETSSDTGQHQLSIELKAQSKLGLASLKDLISTELTITLKNGSGACLRELPIYRAWRGSMNEFSGSEETLHTIQSWLTSCSDNHEVCQLPSGALDFIPTRLIYVGEGPRSKTLRLVETGGRLAEQRRSGKLRFTALSHCWGGHINLTLREQNYMDLKNTINIYLLPANFRDAVSITRRLEVPYLWIDSLCIIQDSQRDWEKESPKMGQIYSAADFVIAATASASSAGGCFRYRDSVWEPAIMRDSAKLASYYTLGDVTWQLQDLFREQVESAPLTKRAWAFQERLLSRRMVHFSSDVVLFECNAAQSSEYDPEDLRTYPEDEHTIWAGKMVNWLASSHSSGDAKGDRISRGIRGALKFLLSLRPITQEGPDRASQAFGFSKRWYELVSAYSEGELTKPTDKLMALSGVADLVQQQHKIPYLAGLWNHGDMVAIHLLWAARSTPLRKKQTLYCAPSWSWASIDGRVELLPRIDIRDYKNIHVVSRVKTAAVYFRGERAERAGSLVDDGVLHIDGPAVQVQVCSARGRPGYSLVSMDGANQATQLRFFPDWLEATTEAATSRPRTILPPEQPSMLAIQLMRFSKRVSVGWQVYGIVVRSREGMPGQFERIGVFQAGHSEQASAFQGWEQQNIVVK